VTDLELLIIGATVTFIAVSGAYVAIRHRANELPVDSYKRADANRHGLEPTTNRKRNPMGRAAHNGSALHSQLDTR
jgi:hypothetical protein